MKSLRVFSLLLIACQSTAFSYSPEQPIEFEPWKVVSFLNDVSENDNPLVMINAGMMQGVIDGLLLSSYRASNPPVSHGRMQTSNHSRISNDRMLPQKIVVPTGQLKIRLVQDTYSIAEVIQQGSVMSRALFQKFPGIMVGDYVKRKQINLAKTKIMTPETTLPYFQLFKDPKGNPETFELSPSGIDALRKASEVFAKSRVSLLMVEGYTDHNGLSSQNQIESYQRALTVRQYLIEELGFDPERVVAVGYGEGEQVDQSMVAGYRANNRRIVLKVVEHPIN